MVLSSPLMLHLMCFSFSFILFECEVAVMVARAVWVLSNFKACGPTFELEIDLHYFFVVEVEAWCKTIKEGDSLKSGTISFDCHVPSIFFAGFKSGTKLKLYQYDINFLENNK